MRSFRFASLALLPLVIALLPTTVSGQAKSVIEYLTDGNTIYVLWIDKLGNTDYRTDPDNSKHYKGRVWVAKITPDGKGLEKDIASLYAAGYTQDRATIALVAGKLKVFVNEKTAQNNYGQTGYVYTLNKNTLAVEDQTTLFTNSNMGWHPYFDSDGTLFHFAYAGYYQYRNTTRLESMIPATAVLIAQNKKLIAGGKAGDLKTAMSYDDFNKTIAGALLSKMNGRREETTNTNTTQTARTENKIGDGASDYSRGLALLNGANTEKNIAVAKMWFQSAANQGYEPAKNIIAEIENATGTSITQTAQNNTQNNAGERSTVRGIDYSKLSLDDLKVEADDGNVKAQVELKRRSNIDANNTQTAQNNTQNNVGNHSTAREDTTGEDDDTKYSLVQLCCLPNNKLARLANKGNFDACVALLHKSADAWKYYDSDHKDREKEQANARMQDAIRKGFKCLGSEASSGSVDAFKGLVMHWASKETKAEFSSQLDEGEDTYLRRAAEAGNPVGQFAYGDILFRFGLGNFFGFKKADNTEYFSWMLKAAKQGLPAACRDTAVAYHNGAAMGTTETDFGAAHEWLQIAKELIRNDKDSALHNSIAMNEAMYEGDAKGKPRALTEGEKQRIVAGAVAPVTIFAAKKLREYADKGAASGGGYSGGDGWSWCTTCGGSGKGWMEYHNGTASFQRNKPTEPLFFGRDWRRWEAPCPAGCVGGKVPK